MTTEKAILEALQKGVLAAAAASTLPAIQVKYVGRNFTPPSDAAWLEVVHIPNNLTDEFWAEGKTHQGIMRLILHYPMKDRGAYDPMLLAESIGAYFYKGRILSDVAVSVRVRINDNPNLIGVLEEPPEMLIPLSIRYHLFKAP